MKLNKEALKRIIKEELEAVLCEEEEEEAELEVVLAAYKDYAENKIGVDLKKWPPTKIPPGLSSNHPDGAVLLPDWARTGSFKTHMRNALGDKNISYEHIKDLVLSATGYYATN